MKVTLGVLAVAAALASASAFSEIKYYTEYKNTLGFNDLEYIDNTAMNDLRVGAQGEHLYLELGPTELDGEVGAGFEAGYKYQFKSFEFKGKWEGRQLDTFEGDNLSKFETEVRYYFN